MPEASKEDIGFVENNYPVAGYKNILSDNEWKQACNAISKGGVFNTHYEDCFDGERYKFGIKRVVLYNEELANTRNSLTGELFSGTLKYVPPVDSKGGIIEEVDRDYPFYVITHKMNLHTQSRTTSHRWSAEVFPENFVMINEKNAERLGLKDNDEV